MASLRCISLIIKGLHLVRSVNSRRKQDVYKRQHQGSDTCTVFAGQPVSQLPEHDTVDITEDFGLKINELIEHGPAFQLSLIHI